MYTCMRILVKYDGHMTRAAGKKYPKATSFKVEACCPSLMAAALKLKVLMVWIVFWSLILMMNLPDIFNY